MAALCTRIPGIEGERYIRNHMGIAMKHGASQREVFETLQCAQFPCGGPTMLVGMKSLSAVLADQEDKKT